MDSLTPTTARYAAVNGLQLYYEIYGSDRPLVLLHGGGGTIRSTFGRILPLLAHKHQVVAVELQAHGHTLDVDRPLSFEQDADDVAALLDHLGLAEAAVLGFSNGGTTALQVAIRHPSRVTKLVLASALYRREGMVPGFFEGMKQASFEHLPPPLRDVYLAANPDPVGLQTMFDRDVARMLDFEDISDDAIRSVAVPALVLNGDEDMVRPEHALALARTLPRARLAILPAGHEDYLGGALAVDGESSLPASVAGLITAFLAR